MLLSNMKKPFDRHYYYVCGKCVVFQKRTCPCKLYEPAKRYSRNNRVFGTFSLLLKSKIGVQVSGIFALNLAGNDKPLGARL